jgi:transketolase
LAYGWNVLGVSDANDTGCTENALDVFRNTKGRPMIILDSHLGYGAPHKQDTAAARGEPLGEEEIRLKAFPELAAEIDQMQRRELPAGWGRNLLVFRADPKGIAGRDISSKLLNVIAQNIPWFLGGSADPGASNRTLLTYEAAGEFQADTPAGKNLYYGIREHTMASIVNGLSLSKLGAFGTFFIFNDYARPAIRFSAIMELPRLFVFTHDAMGDGEDGPTHQPFEQLASLRAVPGLVKLRPADANEVVEAYRYILQLRHAPVALMLSRQPLPTFDRTKYAQASGLARGAYVLGDAPGGNPEIILIASGCEVRLAVNAHETLLAQGIRSRVVSMPSWNIFDHQSQDYRNSMLPPAVKALVAIEQASTFGWERFTGYSGRIIGMKTFGASAPLEELQRKFRFEHEHVVAAAKELLGRS